jgi:hypothetical protein
VQANAKSICWHEDHRHIVNHHCFQQQVLGHQRRISQKIFQMNIEHLHAEKNPVHHGCPADGFKSRLAHTA